MPNKDRCKERKHRILVVDDDEGTRTLLNAIYTHAGMHVDCAESAESAVQLYSIYKYDLITLDCVMPGIDGAGFHKMLSHMFGFGRAVSPVLPQRLPPILVITSGTESDMMCELSFGERVAGIIQKPIEPSELLRVSGELLHHEHNRSKRRETALSRVKKHVIKSKHSLETVH